MDPLSSMLNNKRDSGNRTFARIEMRKCNRLMSMRKLHTSEMKKKSRRSSKKYQEYYMISFKADV
jgi:hypothetical protein